MAEPISLIWSENDKRRPFASTRFIDDLKLKGVFDVNIFSSPTDRLDLCDFFSVDMDTVRMRNELFTDLIENKDMVEPLKELTRDLYDLRRINMSVMEIKSAESELFRVKEISIYTGIIERFYRLFKDKNIKSRSLRLFFQCISEIYHSEDFIKLRTESEKLDSSINNIKSVTVGVNLDPQLRPVEAGIIGVNDKSFISGNIIDKLLRMDIKGSEYECLAPLEAVSRNLKQRELDAMSLALNNGLYTVFSRSVSGWKGVIRKYTGEKTTWLCSLIPELSFIVGCVKPLIELSDRNYPLCMAKLGENEYVTELYNPAFVLFDTDVSAVKNTLTFDENGKIHILTGPNQGGKSVFVGAVGYLYAMFHLGLLLPASSAIILPIDGIYTQFPSKGADNFSKGRFASECSDISDICRSITDKSLFLFDESFSTTGNVEAVTVASEILSAYGYVGCKGIFATHLHDLCNMTDEINALEGTRSLVDNISARIDPLSEARTYIIEKGSVYGKSFAYDIAKKYGLTKEDILNKAYESNAQ